MRDGWCDVAVGDICHWASGKFLAPAQRHVGGRYPVLGANGEIGRTDHVLYTEPVITVGRVGACGEVHVSTGPCWVSDNALVARPKGGVTFDFMRILLESLDYESLKGGTNQPLITQTRLKEVRVSLPPVSAQRRISDLLSHATWVARTATAQSLAAGQAMDASLDHALETLVGEEFCRLADLAIVERGVTWGATQERSEPAPDSWPVVRIGNVQRSGLDMSDRLHIVDVADRDVSRSRVRNTTLLMVGSNGNPERVGNVFIADETVEGHLLASFLIGIHASDPLTARYLWRCLQSRAFQRAVARAISGSTGLKNLSLSWVRSSVVPWPSSVLRERIADVADAFDEVRKLARREADRTSAALTSLRAGLLTGPSTIHARYDRFLEDAW